MSGLFISYRRQDTAYIAGRLNDELSRQFGARQIFRDVDNMAPGVDFVKRIDEAVSMCQALVAVIGDDWLTATDAKGKRRIDNPRDWVRVEIAAAMKRDILIVPVLVEGASMPSPPELPPALRKLARFNALELTDVRWDYDTARLVEALEAVVSTRPPATRRPAVRTPSLPRPPTRPSPSLPPRVEPRPVPSTPPPPAWSILCRERPESGPAAEKVVAQARQELLTSDGFPIIPPLGTIYAELQYRPGDLADPGLDVQRYRFCRLDPGRLAAS